MWYCCLFPGSSVTWVENEPRGSPLCPTQCGAAAAGYIIPHTSDITPQTVLWPPRVGVGSRWHISTKSTSALARVSQPASLIISSMWLHFQGPSPPLKEAVLFLQVLLGNSLESKCSAMWGPGHGAPLKIRLACRPAVREETKASCYKWWGNTKLLWEMLLAADHRQTARWLQIWLPR